METKGENKAKDALQGLTCLVFAWSLKDILDRNLYKDQVLHLVSLLSFSLSLFIKKGFHKLESFAITLKRGAPNFGHDMSKPLNSLLDPMLSLIFVS